MPANPRSLRVTEAYRERLLALRERVEDAARRSWPDIDGLDESPWPERMTQVVTRAQVEGVRLSAAYLGAYLRTETGRGSVPPLDVARYAGRSRDGRFLSETLRSPLVGVLGRLKAGAEPAQALSYGLKRAQRMVETDLMHAARESLRVGMEREPRIAGWQRAVRGTCGACLGDIAVEVSVQLPSVPLRVHPNCLCQTQPVVVGVPQTVPMLSGVERFRRMSTEEQDAEFGPEKAEALREERISLSDLVAESHLVTGQPDFITERPLEAVT